MVTGFQIADRAWLELAVPRGLRNKVLRRLVQRPEWNWMVLGKSLSCPRDLAAIATGKPMNSVSGLDFLGTNGNQDCSEQVTPDVKVRHSPRR